MKNLKTTKVTILHLIVHLKMCGRNRKDSSYELGTFEKRN